MLIRRDIYEPEESAISCRPPLVPLKKQSGGSTFLLGDNSQRGLSAWALKGTHALLDHPTNTTHNTELYKVSVEGLGQI